MSTEANKAIVRELFDSVDKGLDAFLAVREKHFDPNIVAHFGSMPAVDYQGHAQFTREMFAAFPDMRQPVDDLIAEGDKVVARFTSSAHHNGPMWGIPPTGRAATAAGITIFRLANGKVVEQWTELDLLGLMQQLGAIPAPA